MAGRGCLLMTSAFLVQTSPVPCKHAQAVTDFSVGGAEGSWIESSDCLASPSCLSLSWRRRADPLVGREEMHYRKGASLVEPSNRHGIFPIHPAGLRYCSAPIASTSSPPTLIFSFLPYPFLMPLPHPSQTSRNEMRCSLYNHGNRCLAGRALEAAWGLPYTSCMDTSLVRAYWAVQ